ncbi:MAG: SHOCT domain-containing protein [Terracidiphilus sp.]
MIEPIPERLERMLATSLHRNERVFVKLRGVYKEALVCTDSRVIILKAGWMTGQLFGTDMFQCPYQNVAGAQVKFELLTGYFELSAGGMQNTTKHFWSTRGATSPAKAANCVTIAGSDRATLFRQVCAFIMQRSSIGGNGLQPNDDSLGTLERLAKLRDTGVISTTEFEQKKTQILSRI